MRLHYKLQMTLQQKNYIKNYIQNKYVDVAHAMWGKRLANLLDIHSKDYEDDKEYSGGRTILNTLANRNPVNHTVFLDLICTTTG